MALVFWGLRLFKIYIILIGIAFGGGLGFFLGSLAGHSLAAAITAGVILAIVGGLAAWPLQKIFVFIAAGLSAAWLGVILAISQGMPPDGLWVIGLILFVAGGAVALAFYEPFIIIMLSFGAGESIFQLISPLDAMLVNSRNFGHIIDIVYRFYAQYFLTFLLLILVFVGFGLYFQRIIEYAKNDTLRERRLKAVYRRSCYLFASLALLGFAAKTLAPSGGRLWYVILGPNLVSWPLIGFVVTFLLAYMYRTQARHEKQWLPWHGAAFALFIAAVLIPVCNWVVTLVLVQRVASVVYWKSYFVGPAWVITLKWIYTLVLFPSLYYFAVLKWKPTQLPFLLGADDARRPEKPYSFGDPLKTPSPIRAHLVCLSGVFAGEKFPLDKQDVTLGRDPDFATIVFPRDQPLISRRHAMIRFNPRRERYSLEDLGSSAGTFLGSGEKLHQGVPRVLFHDEVFYLGSNNQTFRIESAR
ncbi:MAG: FHA domain-containing protein [Desulfarculaceae bacterium]|nr:FHA domain-containing protein [Desulfarculaceae bacterium]MCF8072142.1 FHA domain-containing protein [Desulfarculaceae bacterium]MCF8100063.1 FHA domain-containing protein [Desulfarculaceae bacterium]MCF8118270.1 FHA domain-containing protein [Desulfarculaceae bacterium]